MASQVARLGGSSGFIGSVGQDEHGLYLIETMKKLGIDVSCLRISDKEATRITFVYLNQGNDRYFSNYQSPRADHDLPEDEAVVQAGGQLPDPALCINLPIRGTHCGNVIQTHGICQETE